MKNYNEIANNVLERRDKFETEKRNRRRFIAKTVTPICCICLIALLGVSVWQGGLFKDNSTQIANDSIYPGLVDHYGPDESPTENKIIINNITSSSMDRVKIDYEIRPKDFVKMDKSEINAYYGVNIFPTVPNDIKEWNDSVYGIYKKNGGIGEIYWDQAVLNYSNEDFTRGVNIEIKKDTLPTLDYVNESLGETSIINNWNVTIGYCEQNHYYQANFIYKNVGFCVNTYGLTQDEFITVISSILK